MIERAAGAFIKLDRRPIKQPCALNHVILSVTLPVVTTFLVLKPLTLLAVVAFAPNLLHVQIQLEQS